VAAGCRPPIFIERVFDEPGVVRDLLERGAPYHPVQRYFRSDAEYRAQSGRGKGPMIVAPNFRGDWAYERPLLPGAELVLQHEGFRKAAAEIFGSDLVRPHDVYSNLTWQLPFDQGAGHTDVPAFRGIERTNHPTWFLSAMGHSGLFEEERIEIATAVAWFYEGRDGGFSYWPDGPDAPPRIHEGTIHNTAIVGDNDRMYHRVRPVGRREDGLLAGLGLDARLEHDGGDAWAIRQDGDTLATLHFRALRVSLSWKAFVFRDEAQMRSYDEHTHDLTLEDVLDRFASDFAARGERLAEPGESLQDPAFVEQLARAYVHRPTVQG
jgi:hypothetical protein